MIGLICLRVLLFSYLQSDAKYVMQFRDVKSVTFALVCSFFTSLACWAMVSYKKLSFSMDVPRAAWSWMMINSVVYIFFLVMFYLAILALS